MVFIGRASETYEKTKRNYQRNVDLGLMSEASKEKNLERLRKQLKASINIAEVDQSKKEKEERRERLNAIVSGHRGYWVDEHGKVKRA